MLNDKCSAHAEIFNVILSFKIYLFRYIDKTWGILRYNEHHMINHCLHATGLVKLQNMKVLL